MPSPEDIRANTDAILRAKEAITLAEAAHTRLDDHADSLRSVTQRVGGIEDSHVVINSKLDRLISVLPDLIILVRDRRNRAWLSKQVIEYGKVAAGLSAVAGLVYGMFQVAAGLLR